MEHKFKKYGFRFDCPVCGLERYYRHNYLMLAAMRKVSKCTSCRSKNKSDEHKRKIGEAVSKYRTGKTYEEIYGIEGALSKRKHHSEVLKGKKRPEFSQEWKNNLSKGHKNSQIFKDAMNSTEYKDKRAKIAVETKLGISYESWLENIPERKKYYLDVWRITRDQPLHTLENYDKRGHILQEGKGYQLDHIYPIAKGYENNIPADVIGHISNLQMLTASENAKKGAKIYEVSKKTRT